MPHPLTDRELFDRSTATLIRSWAYLASGSPGAEVIDMDGGAIALFVHSPDRDFLNNTVLPRGGRNPDPILDLAERTYAEREVDRYAVWVHESEVETAGAVRRRGYAFDTSTRTMAMELGGIVEVEPSRLDIVEPSPTAFWRLDGLEGLVPELSPEGAHFYVARLDGEDAAMLMAFDHEGDCGIYMVGTVAGARRRGLATALSAHAVAAARERGCATVSLQSTEMAEGVYARVGFRDLGRFDEYVSTPARDRTEETM